MNDQELEHAIDLIRPATPSEIKAIYQIWNQPTFRVLCIERVVGGWLLVSYERTEVRVTKKHEWPFRYSRKAIGKRGARLHSWSGNVWDYEEKTIIDDFTEIKSSHVYGYKS